MLKRVNIYLGEIYEHAVFQSIEEEDIEGFERNYEILNFYYKELKYVFCYI